MPRLYDISRTISPALAVWPGDAPFSAAPVLRLADGDSVNLTTLTLSAHTGSHADAPWHYAADGAHPADLPLDKYMGPVHVVTVARRHGGITPADLGPLAPGSGITAQHPLARQPVTRLLLHTWVSDLPDDRWPEDFPYPAVELIDWLAAQGGVLLGLDSPSVDAADSTDLPGHHRLKQHGLANLETLCLRGVPDGVYELIALPLKIAGVCGSPVRAVLRELAG